MRTNKFSKSCVTRQSGRKKMGLLFAKSKQVIQKITANSSWPAAHVLSKNMGWLGGFLT